MKYWTYIVKDQSGHVVAEYTDKDTKKEQDSRKNAVKVMQALISNRERELNPFHKADPPFTLVITVHTDTCQPLRMGAETYSEKEILEYGTGEDLSLGELLSLAKDNYAKGGDTVYECWDQRYYDDYVSMFGPVRRRDVGNLFRTLDQFS